MTTPYCVRLVGAGSTPASGRIAAEIRFLMELERALGGQRGVMAAWQEDAAALEAWDATAGADTPAPRTLWDQVFGAASGVALGEVAVPGAHFVFSPVTPSTGPVHAVAAREVRLAAALP
ncbi:MAG: hypothetical protein ABI919_04915 [Ramlibacter sp.]